MKSKSLLFTSAIFSSLWHKTDISAQIILGLGRVILKTGVKQSQLLSSIMLTYFHALYEGAFIIYSIYYDAGILRGR